MVFVTVGTHEQPFNRLIRKVNELKKDGKIKDDVIIQTGYSDYEPEFCQWRHFFSYQEMSRLISDARIVITHGGPSSFILPLQMKKVPIVVPRRKEFGEHVNNHQLDFCCALEKRNQDIIVVRQLDQLERILLSYEELTSGISVHDIRNNQAFCEALEQIVLALCSADD